MNSHTFQITSFYIFSFHFSSTRRRIWTKLVLLHVFHVFFYVSRKNSLNGFWIINKHETPRENYNFCFLLLPPFSRLDISVDSTSYVYVLYIKQKKRLFVHDSLVGCEQAGGLVNRIQKLALCDGIRSVLLNDVFIKYTAHHIYLLQLLLFYFLSLFEHFSLLSCMR